MDSVIEVEYQCPNCNMKFVVYHRDDFRNKHCCWCDKEVTQTGKVSKIEGNDIVIYQDDKEIGREPKRE